MVKIVDFCSIQLFFVHMSKIHVGFSHWSLFRNNCFEFCQYKIVFCTQQIVLHNLQLVEDGQVFGRGNGIEISGILSLVIS